MNKRKLEKERKKIDLLDKKLLNLIIKRTKIVHKIIKIKKSKKQIIYNKRFRKVLRNIKVKSIKRYQVVLKNTKINLYNVVNIYHTYTLNINPSSC